MISPGKQRAIGAAIPGTEKYEALVYEKFNLSTAKNPQAFLDTVQGWASLNAYTNWYTSYKANQGNFLDHAVWGADRALGDGKYLYGAMDDRYASNAARLVDLGKFDLAGAVAGKDCCVIGGWDGTEALLLLAMGAKNVVSIDEVEPFCSMANIQFAAWDAAALSFPCSLYEMDPVATYDFVYVPGVLYHLTDLPTAMVLLWSLLKPGGKLAFETMAEGVEGASYARYLGPSLAGWNWWSPSVVCYTQMMHDCGFPDGNCVEFTGGRGWWVGTKDVSCKAIAHGAAGFARPDILRILTRRET